MAGIQESDVWKAADALLLEGQRPTIERVRQKIGRGSPNTVSPLLETWFRQLGARIKDPKAFSAVPALPDPVAQAAKHFWETALAQTRLDFDERLRDGLASAVANVEAEKERAAQASAAAFEAAARAAKLQAEVDGLVVERDTVRQLHAAERARLEEVRLSLATLAERLHEEERRGQAESTDLKRQLAAAHARADAADRRVALELERERAGRSHALRQLESLQGVVEGLQAANATADARARKEGEAAHAREHALQQELAAARSELKVEQHRFAERSAACDASAAEAAAARSQIVSLQATVERLAAAVGPQPQRGTKAVNVARKRTGK